MDTTLAFKYRAFLSYSHRDIGWAKWLHARLEAFRFDKELIGRETFIGPVPKTLRPIFRDREDFSGGHTLTDATVEALDASAALIVLCSSSAASRPAVNEEVRLFRSRHPDRPVIPVIVEGTAPGNFPPALRFELDADGKVTDRQITILGPDLREGADGKNLGLAKTIAGLAGLGADDIFHRAERARRRQTRIWGTVAGFCLLLAILASGSAVYAWHELKTNEAFLSATLKTATEIVNTSVAQAEKYGVPRAATLELLNKAEGLFDNMARYSRPTPELQYNKAWMLIQFARNYTFLGDTGKELAHADEAYRILAGLAAARPNATAYQSGLAAAYIEIGDVQFRQGHLADALKSYTESLAISQRLARKSDVRNVDYWQRELSVPYGKVGDVQMAQGNLAGAETSYYFALGFMQRLAQSDPSNASWQFDLSVFYEKVGGVQMARGNPAGAMESYRAGLAIRERLAQSDPNNAVRQRNLSVLYNKVGHVQMVQGDLAAATKSFSEGFAIAQRLAQSDPNNASWQSDLSISYDTVGNVQMARGNLAGAMESYRDSLAIRQRLAQSDPSNAGSQHDLSVEYERVGNVQMAQGDFAGAIKSYRDDLAVRQRLAQSDPSNASWQRDLSVSYDKVGDVQKAQGDVAAALKSFSDSLAIRQRLVQLDPSNAVWQYDLAMSYYHAGELQLARGDLAAALKFFSESLAITQRLVQSNPSNAVWQYLLSMAYNKVGRVQKAQGNLPAALKSIGEALASMQRIAQSDPGNASWQSDLAINYRNLASTYLRSKDDDHALAALRQGQAIIERLTKLSPENTTRRHDLAWFNNQIEALTKQATSADKTEVKQQTGDETKLSTQAAIPQRVVLYEEDTNDPQGKRFNGSVTWRTEMLSPGPNLAVHADVEIPERHITVTWLLRRNTNQDLPTSDTIEILFNLPAEFPEGGINDVPGVLMKQTEQARGTPLAGVAVKVTSGFFRIQLSAVDANMRRNFQLLKEFPWIDVLLVYASGGRAVLAMEKGTPGDHAFADAFGASERK